MAEQLNITQINGIIQELQRQNAQLSNRCAELNGLLVDALGKIPTEDIPDEVA